MEEQIRQRLGKIIFGSNQDTLAGVTLAALGKRGWTMVTLESGLDGRLSRQLHQAAHPNLLSAKDETLPAGVLADKLQALKDEQNADVALGIAFFPSEEKQIAEVLLITPKIRKSRTLHYGGHPKNALRWAPNLALNILRRAAEG